MVEGGSGDRTGATPNSELGYGDILIPPASATSDRKSRDASTFATSPLDGSSQTDLKDMQQDTQDTQVRRFDVLLCANMCVVNRIGVLCYTCTCRR